MATPNSAQFTVTYDGEALRDHEIDVRDLAPALLAIGQLFEGANRVLNGERAQISVKLRATGEGSVEVALDLVQSFGRQIESFLLSTHVQAAINLRDLVGMGACGLGLVATLKWLRGRKPKKLSEKEEQVTLSVDAETLVVPVAVIRLMEDIPVREALERVLSPLRRDGIDTFQMKDSGGAVPSVEITREQLAYFDPPSIEAANEEKLPERRWTSAYTIVSLSFKEENKWRLSDGQAVISAAILDEDFLKRVDQRLLSFSKGDVLVCQIRQRQTQTPEGLRTEYDVIHVDEYKPAPKQYKLFE